MKKYIFSIAFLALICFNASAQKYGFLNSGLLVEEIAVIEDSDKQLQDFQVPLFEEGEKMVKAFEAKKEKFYEEVNQGLLSQIAIEQRQQALQEEAKTISDFELGAKDKVLAKRQELLGPILERIQKAIDEVAKEGGYNMIFDASVMNALLYTQPENDVTALVKAKLGM